MEAREDALIEREVCPQGGSRQYKRNGPIQTGKQNHRGKACGRAFVLRPQTRMLTDEQRALVERLLLERSSLRGICRAVGVGCRGLLQFLGECFQAAPTPLNVQSTAGTPGVLFHRREANRDELWSFVVTKANRQGVWRALDAATRQGIAFHLGDRSGQSATALGEQMPTL